MAVQDENPGDEPDEAQKPTWRVDASFYIEADTAADARAMVEREVNSTPVQKLIGDTVGNADVHETATPWDMAG